MIRLLASLPIQLFENNTIQTLTKQIQTAISKDNNLLLEYISDNRFVFCRKASNALLLNSFDPVAYVTVDASALIIQFELRKSVKTIMMIIHIFVFFFSAVALLTTVLVDLSFLWAIVMLGGYFCLTWSITLVLFYLFSRRMLMQISEHAKMKNTYDQKSLKLSFKI